MVMAADASTVVYSTKTGECYHNDGCRSLSRSKIETTLGEAVNRGLLPCDVCKFPKLTETTKADNKTSTNSKKESNTKVNNTAKQNTTTSKATVKNKSSKYSTADNKNNSVIKSTIEKSGKYVGNANTHKFHLDKCNAVNDMQDKVKVYANSRDEMIKNGYSPCLRCKP